MRATGLARRSTFWVPVSCSLIQVDYRRKTLLGVLTSFFPLLTSLFEIERDPEGNAGWGLTFLKKLSEAASLVVNLPALIRV
jgi:hypothetical protein